MRRLPVYFLIGTPGFLYGELTYQLNNALSSMINTLRADAQALDSLCISIITFERDVQEIMPLTELVSFQLPEVTCLEGGGANLGLALNFLCQK